MLTALKATRQKLRDYYAKTEDMNSTILAPNTRLQVFSGPK